jgi:HPt (histidine-containing phosphotransfer) domain-containing protein
MSKSVKSAQMPSGIDRQTFDQLFSFVDADMRRELLTQICTDFERLLSALSAPSGRELARSGHEIKGLAATVGARALAASGERLQIMGEVADPAMLETLVAQVRGELQVVLGLFKYELEQ